VMHKRNALDHPAAQIAENLTVADVMNSTLLSWPVKRLDISPTSDAAVAIVLTNERIARAKKTAPVYIEGVGYRLDTAYWCTRDLAYPNYVAMAAQDAYSMAGIRNPVKDIDIFEPYDPFDYKALHHMNALCLDKTGRTVKDFLASGAFERATGSHPMCPSGGALGVGNPIAATGLMKIAELYFQLSGQAGKRQINRSVRRGVAQAWGDLMQVGTVVVMGAEGAPPTYKSPWSTMTKADLGATPIKDVNKVPHIDDVPDLRYYWDNGQSLTTYLDGLKNGKIRGSLCKRTGRMMIPPRTFDEMSDLDPVHDYFDLPDTGTVMTYTLSHVNWDSSQLPNGQINIFAVIAIDGAGENVGLVHRLGEVDSKDVKIGMRVKAVWKPAEERTGTILDIRYFAPIKGKEKGKVSLVPIKPVELDATTAKGWPGKIPLTYKYTAGVAGTRFYTDLAAGKITGTYSAALDAVLLPPAEFDEHAMEILDSAKDARAIDPNSGMIESFTVVFEDRSGHPLDEPVTIVQVRFPGAIGSVFGRLETKSGAEFGEGSPVKLLKRRKITGPDEIMFQLK
jgi:uncharacterized OB-fold protein